MKTCAGTPRSTTAFPGAYSSLPRPTIVVPGRSCEVELASMHADFTGVARFTRWRSPASTSLQPASREGRRAPAGLSSNADKTEWLTNSHQLLSDKPGVVHDSGPPRLASEWRRFAEEISGSVRRVYGPGLAAEWTSGCRAASRSGKPATVASRCWSIRRRGRPSLTPCVLALANPALTRS